MTLKVHNPRPNPLSAKVYGRIVEVPVGDHDPEPIRTADGAEYDSSHVAGKIYEQLHGLGVTIVPVEEAEDRPIKTEDKPVAKSRKR